MARFSGLLGIIVLLGIAYIFSTNRRAIRVKTILWGLGLQFLFAVLVLRVSYGEALMRHAGDAVSKFLSYTVAGSSFVFGNLGMDFPLGVFAFRVLPTIIFVSAFFALLYHIGVMQVVIKGMAWVMTRSDGGERRGIPERGCVGFCRPDGSPAEHPSFFGGRHPL